MEHKETRTEPAREVTYVIKTTCDLCGDIIKNQYSSFDKDEVTIQREIGSNYPEGGWGTYYEVDMCTKCWETKFVKWLEEQKVSLNERDYNW